MLPPRVSALAAVRPRTHGRAPSPLLRLAVVLLALVQVVAPSWHVCALGGSSCHGGPARAQVWTPKCGGGPVCPCVKPPGAIASLTGQVLDGQGGPDHAGHGTCLALLLMSMPGAAAAAFALPVLLTHRAGLSLPALLLPSCASLRRPPARGPPLPSFA